MNLKRKNDKGSRYLSNTGTAIVWKKCRKGQIGGQKKLEIHWVKQKKKRNLLVVTKIVVGGLVYFWWLVEVPFWFKASFSSKFWESIKASPREVKYIILHEVRFNRCEAKFTSHLSNSSLPNI